MRRRLRLEIRGAVQGVGFRPFVHRLAHELDLAGFVANDASGVVLEAEGDEEALERLLGRLATQRPEAAVVQEMRVLWLEPAGHRGFSIAASSTDGPRTAEVLPDLATCGECLAEILDPADRRHRYPFTNCTRCGPRFSIVRALPYDRARTTMERFAMCEACRREYEEPADRRFHAQPNACPACGPRLALTDVAGVELAREGAALDLAARELGRGAILAVKGLGGFHLMVDARSEEAVRRLRERKPRREKPLALMVRDLDEAERLCQLDGAARAELASPEAPILLLRRRETAGVAPAVAPGNPCLGLMLAATPLHHLLLRAAGFPVVATSGNLSEEPICTDESEALERLSGIADRFLVHDRPIARHVDDSVAFMLEGRLRLLRRARGFAPRPVLLDAPAPAILAVGAQLQNTVALSVQRQVFISQHIGDMESVPALAAFERVVRDFIRLYDSAPEVIACDLHPDYAAAAWARSAAAGERGLPRPLPRLVAVQHHHAHLAACLVDSAHHGPALGVTWDGTGYGGDGSVWGGEFLVGDARSFRRVGHLLPFSLPGGEAAVREPRRSAIALLWEIEAESALEREDLAPIRSFRRAERTVLAAMLRRGVNTPRTTSAGRLFDGVAALCGLHPRTSFEGQAAMALEFLADPLETGAYAVELLQPAGAAGPMVLDWRPLVLDLLADLGRHVAAGTIAARFHNALVRAILLVAQAVGQPAVALTGGCMQNRLLVERTARALREAGFEVLLHRQVSPGDGGLSLGQVAVAAAAEAATRGGEAPA